MTAFDTPPSGRPDTNYRECRSCRFWDGDRSPPIASEEREGLCSAVVDGKLPPDFSKVLSLSGVEPITRMTDSCSFHEYQPGRF